MTEDSSYNLTNIKNFSVVLNAKSKAGHTDTLFELFQIGLSYDLSTNDLEIFRVIELSGNVYVNLNDLLENNKFKDFFDHLITDMSIDEAYEKFKRVIELYPSILLRRRRNKKIKKTDFIILEDFGIDETEKQAWKDYRTQLRNITNDIQDDEIILYDDNTFNVEWPSIPNIKLLLLNKYYDFD